MHLYLIIISSLVSCEYTSHPNISSVNQLILNDQNNLLIIGDRSSKETDPYIKLPYILVLDKNLNTIEEHLYPTKTTSKHSRLFINEKFWVLSHYRAVGLDNSKVISELNMMNPYGDSYNKIEYGKRTRFKKLIQIDTNLISLNYQKSDRSLTLGFFGKDNPPRFNKFKFSNESSIPSDIIYDKSSNSLIVCGIAHGYTYRDGHDYINKKTHVFLLQTDTNGNEIKRDSILSTQNLFINNLEIIQDEFLLTGTSQDDRNGMNTIIYKINAELIAEEIYSFNAEGVQEGIKSLMLTDTILTLSKNQKYKSENFNCKLTYSKNGKYIGSQEYGDSKYSYKPTDFLVTKNRIYISANKRSSRIDEPQAVLFEIDKSRKLLREINLF